MSNVGYANKIIKSRFKVDSESSSREYEVIEYEDQTFSCNCMSWIYHKGQRVNCKHILEIINNKPQRDLQIEVKGVKNDK